MIFCELKSLYASFNLLYVSLAPFFISGRCSLIIPSTSYFVINTAEFIFVLSGGARTPIVSILGFATGIFTTYIFSS